MNRPVPVILQFAVAVSVLIAPATFQPARAATNDLFDLDNGMLRVGIERGKGGSITWLSWRGHPRDAGCAGRQVSHPICRRFTLNLLRVSIIRRAVCLTA